MSKDKEEGKNLPAAVDAGVVAALEQAAAQGALAAQDASAFARMFKTAAAVQELKRLLTPQAMAPIMALMGSPIGFKTDKDEKGGYPEEAVKEALIEATLNGVFPTGNEFNIIGGRAFITKEGWGHKLRDVPGLKWSCTPRIPRLGRDGTAEVDVEVEWTLGGPVKKRLLSFLVRLNNGQGADAATGKAVRRARAWLWTEATGKEAAEDAQETEVTARVVGAEVTDAPAPAGDLSAAEAQEKAELVKWLKDAYETVGDVALQIVRDACKAQGVDKAPGLSLAALRQCRDAVNASLNEAGE